MMKKYYLLAVIWMGLSAGFCAFEEKENIFCKHISQLTVDEYPFYYQALLDKIIDPNSPLKIMTKVRSQANAEWEKLDSSEEINKFLAALKNLVEYNDRIGRALSILEGYTGDDLFTKVLYQTPVKREIISDNDVFNSKTMKLAEVYAPEEFVSRKAKATQSAPDFLYSTDHWTKKNRIIPALMSLTQAQISAFEKSKLVLCHYELDVDCRSQVINACMLISPDQIELRAAAIEKYKTGFFHSDMGSYERRDLIIQCMRLTPEQIIAVGEGASTLFSKKEYCGRNGIIWACSSATPQRIKELVQILNDEDLVYEGMGKDERSDIIRACMPLTSNQIKSRIRAMEEVELIVEGMDKYERQKILNVCITLPPRQIKARSQAITKAGLFPEGIDKFQLDGLMGLQPLQIDAVGKIASKLFPEEDNYHSSRDVILKVFRSLTPGKINAIGNNASMLFSDNMYTESYSEIIVACKSLTLEQINAVGSCASKLFGKYKNSKEERDSRIGEKCGRIIKSCQSLSPDQIIVIGNYAVQLIPNSLSVYCRARIIEGCRDLELAQIINHG